MKESRNPYDGIHKNRSFEGFAGSGATKGRAREWEGVVMESGEARRLNTTHLGAGLGAGFGAGLGAGFGAGLRNKKK